MKFESFRFTLCHQKGRLCVDISDSSQSLNATPGGLFRSLLLISFKFHVKACEKCGLAQDPGRIARFEQEAKVLASLNHANIAAIHGFEEVSGRHLLVMELVEGDTLAERIARGPIAIESAL